MAITLQADAGQLRYGWRLNVRPECVTYSRIRQPFRCEGCGSDGPFRALATWVPVAVDKWGEVEYELGEDIWAVLSDDGPGVSCLGCGGEVGYPRYYPIQARQQPPTEDS